MELRLSEVLGLKNTIKAAMKIAADNAARNNVQTTTKIAGANVQHDSADVQHYAADEEWKRWKKLADAYYKVEAAAYVASAPVAEKVKTILKCDAEIGVLRSLNMPSSEPITQTEGYGDDLLTKIKEQTATINVPQRDKRIAELTREKAKIQRELNAFNHETKVTVDVDEDSLPFDPEALVDEPKD